MKTGIKSILLALLIGISASLNAQFTSKKTGDKVHTKSKKEIKTSRQADLGQYKNQLFLIDNAIKSADKETVIKASDNIKVLAKTEIDRANNNLIDLYKMPSKSDKTKETIAKLEKRITLMKHRYDVFKNADMTIDPRSKQANYVYSSMKIFKKYMQENFDEFNAKKESGKSEYTPAKTDVKLDKPGAGMISTTTKGNGIKNSKSNNPEIKKYYDEQKKQISNVSKMSRELIMSLSSKKYDKANGIKTAIASEMQKVVNGDETMLKRVEAGEFKDEKISVAKMKSNIQRENNLITDIKKLKIPEDNSSIMDKINEFNRLNRIL